MSQFSPQTTSGDEAYEENYQTAWYPPNSVAPTPLPYNQPYMTPLPSSTFDMTAFPQSTVPWQTTPGYYSYDASPAALPADSIEGPSSSSNTYGPSSNEINWHTNPLGIIPVPEPGQVLHSNEFPAPNYQHTSPGQVFTTPSPPRRNSSDLRLARSRSQRESVDIQRSDSDAQRLYTTLAPNPAGVASRRRQEREEGKAMPASASKRRKRTPSNDMAEDAETRLIFQCKDRGMAWKDIAAEMEQAFGQSYGVAQLQMRWGRRRQAITPWEDREIEALKEAHEYWEKKKWEIISEKMKEIRVEPRPVKNLRDKWAEISEQQQAPRGQTPRQQRTPTPQHTAPMEALGQFSYIPH